MFHPARVRLSVVCDRDPRPPLYHAGHTGRPEKLALQTVEHKLLQVAHKGDGVARLMERRCNQLQQCLGVVGGDIGVGQRRAQNGWVGGLCDLSIGVDPQALLFESQHTALEQWRKIRRRDTGGLFLYRIGQN